MSIFACSCFRVYIFIYTYTLFLFMRECFQVLACILVTNVSENTHVHVYILMHTAIQTRFFPDL